VQSNLFENINTKHNALMKTIDEINAKLGKQKIRLASQDLDRIWKMRQEKLSPCYTTRLSDIITIKV
jgi:DNA polymerase V